MRFFPNPKYREKSWKIPNLKMAKPGDWESVWDPIETTKWEMFNMWHIGRVQVKKKCESNLTFDLVNRIINCCQNGLDILLD